MDIYIYRSIWNSDDIGLLSKPSHRVSRALPGAHPGATAEFMAVDFPMLEQKGFQMTSNVAGEAT